MKSHYLLAAVAALSMAGAAHAVNGPPTITVTPTKAPNAFGSPSYSTWVQNVNTALHAGLSAYGDPNAPTYFHAQTDPVTGNEVVVTGFPSWNGVADPGAAFGPQYANELGNRMHFAVKIDGNGSQFSISQMSFDAHSADAADELAFNNPAGIYNYSSEWWGVLKGADGILWTGDDVFVTSGLNTQLVDGLVGRGSGNSFGAYCVACTTAQQQAQIDSAGSYYWGTFTGTYSLNGATGSGSFTQAVAAVPEPATWAMMLGGFGLAGTALRRRSRRKVVLA